MPYRRLPQTNAERITALDAIQNKWTITDAAARPFPQALFEQMTPLRADFKREVGEAAGALAAQTAATGAADLTALALEQVVSHFIQVFNMAVSRDVFRKSDRAFYQLDVNQSAVPPLASHADRTTWAQNLIDGEVARIAAAGQAAVPMAMPSIADVQAALAAYTASGNEASRAKDKFDDEQGDIPALLPAVDKIIKDIWDHIEFTLRDEDGPSRRRRCREWGVAYVARPGEEPEEGTTPAPAATTTTPAPTTT